MASSWGNSWGTSWGNSWGTISSDAVIKWQQSASGAELSYSVTGQEEGTTTTGQQYNYSLTIGSELDNE